MPAGLVQILDLEQIELLHFRGRTRPVAETRVFGGEVAAQALTAATRTVTDPTRTVHSMHAYFVRPGDPGRPILYQVDPVRDGRSFTTRRVTGVQSGKPIFVLSASFQVPEDGLTHQVPRLDEPDPDGLPTAAEAAGSDPVTAGWLAALDRTFPIELRFPEGLPRMATARGEAAHPRQVVWMRTTGPLGDDPAMHACAATYASDLLLLSTALLPHRLLLNDPRLQIASLDHAVWFHAPFRADDWLCYEQESPWAGGGRSLCRGQFFDRAGTLVASVMQEGLIRVRA